MHARLGRMSCTDFDTPGARIDNGPPQDHIVVVVLCFDSNKSYTVGKEVYEARAMIAKTLLVSSTNGTGLPSQTNTPIPLYQLQLDIPSAPCKVIRYFPESGFEPFG